MLKILSFEGLKILSFEGSKTPSFEGVGDAERSEVNLRHIKLSG